MSKKNKTVIILGSSRSQGDTFHIVQKLTETGDFDLIDLNEYDISYYDYDHKNQDDDFLPLMKKLIENYETFVFATPVYWYSMSAIMKTFFDRISDLLTIKKDLGRKLRGRNMALISCSNEDDLPTGFSMPFEKSAEYLGMNWLGEMHGWLENEIVTPEVNDKIQKFIENL